MYQPDFLEGLPAAEALVAERHVPPVIGAPLRCIGQQVAGTSFMLGKYLQQGTAGTAGIAGIWCIQHAAECTMHSRHAGPSTYRQSGVQEAQHLFGKLHRVLVGHSVPSVGHCGEPGAGGAPVGLGLSQDGDDLVLGAAAQTIMKEGGGL